MPLTFFIIGLVMVFLILMISIQGRHTKIARWAMIGLFLGFVPVGGIGAINFLSKPMPLEWYRALPWRAPLDAVEVVGFRAVEKEAIYVLLVVPGEPEPLSLRLPYSEKSAQEGQQAKISLENGEAGSGATMTMGFGQGGEPEFNIRFPEGMAPKMQVEQQILDLPPVPDIPAQMPNE